MEVGTLGMPLTGLDPSDDHVRKTLEDRLNVINGGPDRGETIRQFRWGPFEGDVLLEPTVADFHGPDLVSSVMLGKSSFCRKNAGQNPRYIRQNWRRKRKSFS
jgi:hypothetical protein